MQVAVEYRLPMLTKPTEGNAKLRLQCSPLAPRAAQPGALPQPPEASGNCISRSEMSTLLFAALGVSYDRTARRKCGRPFY